MIVIWDVEEMSFKGLRIVESHSNNFFQNYCLQIPPTVNEEIDNRDHRIPRNTRELNQWIRYYNSEDLENNSAVLRNHEEVK